LSNYRTAALVLSSSLFFPVSCTTGLVVGTSIIAIADARDAVHGEKPHSQAYMIAALPADPPKIVAFPLYELGQYKEINPNASFLLPAESGTFPFGSDGDTISYVAKRKDAETQIVEVTRQGESEAFFRYEATAKAIKPMYSKLWHHGYMFGAFPYALAFAAVLYFIGKRMRRGLSDASNTTPAKGKQNRPYHIPAELAGVEKSELGTCPNCNSVLGLSAQACPNCQAAFGENSSWTVRPLSGG
jgi:hypothetical protein